MKTFAVQLTKMIVVHVEAESKDAALEQALTNGSCEDYDEEFRDAEPAGEVIG